MSLQLLFVAPGQSVEEALEVGAPVDWDRVVAALVPVLAAVARQAGRWSRGHPRARGHPAAGGGAPGGRTALTLRTAGDEPETEG